MRKNAYDTQKKYGKNIDRPKKICKKPWEVKKEHPHEKNSNSPYSHMVNSLRDIP